MELTESVILQEIEFTMHTLESLNSFGLRLAIDDFGGIENEAASPEPVDSFGTEYRVAIGGRFDDIFLIRLLTRMLLRQ